MYNWKLALALLSCLHMTYAFTCPNNSDRFYHADVSTGCQVYHLCENSQLQTLTCPSGKAFSYATSKCEDASQVDCYETMGGDGHHHHKRSADEQTFHALEAKEREAKLIEVYQSILHIIEEAVKDIVPKIYSTFNVPFKQARMELQTFLYDKLYPQIMNLLQYSGEMIETSAKDIHLSYELSNSRRTSVTSTSDLNTEVSRDVQPVLHLGRQISAKSPTNKFLARRKREMPYFIYTLIRPFIDDALRSLSGTIFGNLDSFTSRVVLPTIYDVLGDAESRFNVFGLFVSAKAAFAPVAWEMLKRQTHDTPEGTVIKIPRKIFEDAKKMFKTESKPFLYKLMEKHLSSFFNRLAENVPAMLEGFRQLEAAKYHHVGVLKDAVLNFLNKHTNMLQSSSYSHINSYTLTEIINDLRPIKITILQIVMEFYRNNRDSFLNVFLGEDSLLEKHVVGPPVYAKLRSLD